MESPRELNMRLLHKTFLQKFWYNWSEFGFDIRSFNHSPGNSNMQPLVRRKDMIGNQKDTSSWYNLWVSGWNKSNLIVIVMENSASFGQSLMYERVTWRGNCQCNWIRTLDWCVFNAVVAYIKKPKYEPVNASRF